MPATLTRMLLPVLLASLFPSAAEAISFGVYASPNGFGGSCGGDSQIISGSTTPPVVVMHYCIDEIGTTFSTASSKFGNLGTMSSSKTFTSSSLFRQDESTADFSDVVFFSKIDQTLSDQFPVSLNLQLSGSLVASSPYDGNAASSVDIVVGLSSAVRILNIRHSTTVANSEFQILNFGNFSLNGNTIMPGDDFITLLTTPTQIVGQGATPFSLKIHSQTNARGNQSIAISEFSQTLKFPTGVDVFNLPTGYTANAGNYLVNNRFVDPDAQTPPPAVPIPPMGLSWLFSTMGALFTRRHQLLAKQQADSMSK